MRGGWRANWRNVTKVELEILQWTCKHAHMTVQEGIVIAFNDSVYVKLYMGVKPSHQGPSTNLGTHVIKIYMFIVF